MSDTAKSAQDLYREVILDHARKPRNFGRLSTATHSADGINPLCGDKLRLYLEIDGNNRIVSLGFEGSGCAISMASASLLTEALADVSMADANNCLAAVTNGLTGEQSTARAAAYLPDLQALDGVRQYPSRIKCATLAWHALDAALKQSSTPATTE